MPRPGMHALIIEDEYVLALDLEDHLRALGFTSFDMAATEEQAIAFARKRQPDLITADMRLREGTGVSAVQRITQERAVPVIYVTGNVEELSDCPREIIVGKPYDAAEIWRTVQAAGVPLQIVDGVPFALRLHDRKPSGGEPGP